MTTVRSYIDTKKASDSPQYLQFPEDIGAQGMLLQFASYAYKAAGTRSLTNSGGSAVSTVSTDNILLPLPNNILDQTETRLNRIDLRLMGDIASNLASDFINKGQSIGSMQEASDYMNNFFSNNLDGSKVYDALKSGNRHEIGAMAAYLLKQHSNDYGNAMSAVTGTAINPKPVLMFEGVELKNHNFSWQFAPRSENETDLIKKIVDKLKYHQLPSYGGDINGGRLFLEYPSTVDIRLVGVSEEHFARYKTSMVRSVTINYTPMNGVSLLKGGVPSSITLEMNLLEMDIHSKNDYMSGGNSTSNATVVN